MTPSGKGSASNVSESTQRAATVNLCIEKPLRISSVSEIPMKLPVLNLHQRSSSLLQFTSATGFDGESEPLFTQRSPRLTALHTSRSTPGLSRQLTSKISGALLHNDTVIHRPKRNSRPIVQTVENEQIPAGQSVAASSQVAMTDISSLPSSVLGSSNTLLSQSTAPTSFVSSGAPMSAETSQRGQHAHRHVPPSGSPVYETNAEYLPSHFLHFPRQDAPRLTEPSVITIENAAAAKVFFEAHFNQLLGTKISPRSMRLRQMERKLFAMALPNEQRHQKRRD